MMFRDDRCKGKAIMGHKPFSVINALWPWPFDPKINRAYPWPTRNFMMISVKGKQLCVRIILPNLAFYSCPWTFDLKSTRPHSQLIRSLYVKFHDDRCKGKRLCDWTILPSWASTHKSRERQTDGQGNSSIPPNKNNFRNICQDIPYARNHILYSLQIYSPLPRLWISSETSSLRFPQLFHLACIWHTPEWGTILVSYLPKFIY